MNTIETIKKMAPAAIGGSTKRIRFVARIFSLMVFSTLCCGGNIFAGTWQENGDAEAAIADNKWGHSLPDAIKQARLQNQYLLVKFHAEWCEPCKELAKLIDVAEFDTAAKDYIRVSIDIDQESVLAQKYDVSAVPTMMILDFRGRLVKQTTGMDSLENLVGWIENLEDVDFGDEVDFLAGRESPTPTEVREVIKFLEKRDATVQQLAIERLVAAPKQSAAAVVDSFVDGKLATQLAAWEILKRWKAPLNELDPWFPKTFSEENIERIRNWSKDADAATGAKKTELQKQEELRSAETEIARYVSADGDSIGSLGRLTRYGADLLPAVYEKIRQSTTDREKERLSVLRYWLVASNELRLQRPGIIVELGANELDSRRQAASTLSEIAKSEDEALLMELFADSDSLIREMGLKTLNRIGTKSTNEALTRLLKDPDANVKAAVLKQLAEKPSAKMISIVGEYLKQETDNDLIVYALKFMKEADDDKTLPYVLDLADAESWQVRAQVAEVLAKVEYDEISDEKLVDQVSDSVFKLLADSDGFVVSRALEGIPPAKTKKSIENLIKVAKSNPDLAEQIVESLNSNNRNYVNFDGYRPTASNNENKLSPFLIEFLTHEDPRLRKAGVKGLVTADSEILKTRVPTLLIDGDSQVRIAATDAVVSLMSNYRTTIDAENSIQGSGESIVVERPSGGILQGAFSMLFGGRSKSKKAEQPDSIPIEELIEEDQPKELSTIEEPALVDSVVEPKVVEPKVEEPKVEEPKEVESKSEIWLGNWQRGDVEKEEWMQEAINALLPLLDATDEEEQAKAAQALVYLGETEKALPLIKKNALKNENWYGASSYALSWLPYESRTDLYFQLTANEQYKDSFGGVLANYAKVQSPKAAKNIWKLISLNSLGGQEAIDALSNAYFGDVSHYQALKEQGVDEKAILDAVADAKMLLDDPDPQKNVIALAFLHRTGHKSVPALASSIASSTSNSKIQRMAIRVALLKQQDDAEAKAIEFLKLAENDSVDIILRFLCVGKSSLSQLPGDDDFYFYNNEHVSYSSSQDSVKVRIPKPPASLQPADIAKLADHEDMEIRGLVNYLQILMQETKDVEPLLQYYDSSQSQGVAKLLYEALSVVDDDALATHLEDIYELHAKDNQWFAGTFYWTIRPMSGKRVLKLRSRMRREIGIQNLNSYR